VLDRRSTYTGVLDLSTWLPQGVDWSLDGLPSLFGTKPMEWVCSADLEKAARFYSHMPSNINLKISKPRVCDNKHSKAGLTLEFQLILKKILAMLLHAVHPRSTEFELTNLQFKDVDRLKELPFDDPRTVDTALLAAISFSMDKILSFEKAKAVEQIRHTTSVKFVDRDNVGSTPARRNIPDPFEASKEITKLEDFELKAKRRKVVRFDRESGTRFNVTFSGSRQKRRGSNSAYRSSDRGFSGHSPSPQPSSLPSPSPSNSSFRGRGRRGRN
jgi:hypothetical protein